MALFDEDGNPVEGALTAEEVREIQEKAEQADAYAQELSKLKEKGINFAEYRKSTEEEKKAMMDGYSAKEKSMIEEIEKANKNSSVLQETLLSEHKENLLRELSGGDEEYRKQIEETALAKFGGEPLSRKSMEERYLDAATLIKGVRPKINPINRYSPVKEYAAPDTASSYTKTAEGDAMFRQKFPKLAAIEDKLNNK